jgi:hypothetical protein
LNDEKKKKAEGTTLPEEPETSPSQETEESEEAAKRRSHLLLLAGTVSGFLKELGIKYEYDDDNPGVWHFRIPTEYREYDIIILPSNNLKLLFFNIIYLPLPEFMSSDFYRTLLEMNYHTEKSYFVVDPNDNFLYIRSAVFVDSMGKEEFQYALDDVTIVANSLFLKIANLIENERKAHVREAAGHAPASEPLADIILPDPESPEGEA